MIYVKRYSPFDLVNQQCFAFDLKNMKLTLVEIKNKLVDGWLIDCEVVLFGPKKIFFFEQNGNSFFAMGHMIVRRDDSVKLFHRRSIFTSSLSLLSEDGECKAVYVTPWWRFFFDDGSHPDMLFPLKFFSERWNSGKSIRPMF